MGLFSKIFRQKKHQYSDEFNSNLPNTNASSSQCNEQNDFPRPPKSESVNSKPQRTEKEEELSFNFMQKYGSTVDSLTEKFEYYNTIAHETDDLTEKILLLSEAAKHFEKARKFCYSKGKGGTIYFQDRWEFMHNSKNPCFSYLDIIERNLNRAILERDSVLPGIMNLLTENESTPLKDIYKAFPEIEKPVINTVLLKLKSDQKIVYEKDSNSYKLHASK